MAKESIMLGFESSIISINLLENNVNEFNKKKFHNFVIVKKYTPNYLVVFHQWTYSTSWLLIKGTV